MLIIAVHFGKEVSIGAVAERDVEVDFVRVDFVEVHVIHDQHTSTGMLLTLPSELGVSEYY